MVYTTSRRKKVKVLPRAPFETNEEAYVPMPRLCSRPFPTKVMVQGIVACPIEEHDFDGKIYLERVSESYHSTRNSFNQNISKYYEVNYELKNGGWKDLFLPYEMFADMNIRDAIESIGEGYELKDIGDICFFHSRIIPVQELLRNGLECLKEPYYKTDSSPTNMQFEDH